MSTMDVSAYSQEHRDIPEYVDLWILAYDMIICKSYVDMRRIRTKHRETFYYG